MKTKTARNIIMASVLNASLLFLEGSIFLNQRDARADTSILRPKTEYTASAQFYDNKSDLISLTNPPTNSVEEKLIRLESPTKLNTQNKNSSIISNEFFRDSDYLTETQIKQLLVEKNSCIKNMGIEKIIVRECLKNSINPIIVVAKLQTEQGLIQQSAAPTKYQLDYAMGVGDLENGKKLPSEGIEYQIRKGTVTLKNRFEEFEEGTKVKINFGKKIIIPENAAAYALYRYTPHDHGTQLHKKVIKRYCASLN